MKDDRTKLQAPQRKPGTVGTVLLMLGLCAPGVWYAARLLGSHGPAAGLADLSAPELLIALALLALPFVALRLLRIEWQRSAEE